MPKISNVLPNLPNESDIKDEELREVVRKYNNALQKLMLTLYGDSKEFEERISALE